MDWMRENKTLSAILAVMVLGGLGLGALLFTSYQSYTASLEQFETANNSVATLKGAKLYPSPENVAAKQTAIGDYETAVSTLGAVLLKLQAPVAKMTETEFQAKLKAGISNVKQLAAKATTLPEGFAFGFDSYTGTLPKNADAATELGDYFAGVEAITHLAIASGVKSIDAMQRSELQVEKGTPAPPPPPPSTSKKKATRPGAKGAAANAKPAKEIAKVVERRTVTVNLTTDQGPLQKMMNDLASPSKLQGFFTVIRQLRVENEKQEGPLRGSIVFPSASSDVTAIVPDAAQTPVNPDGTAVAAPPKVEIIEPAKAAPIDAQAVFGEEMLKVYMEIDIIRFLEPSVESEAAK